MSQEQTGIRRLSPREIECAQWVAKKLTNREIAEKMQISVRTVEGHIENIKRKLNCYSKEQLVCLFQGIFKC